MKKLLRQIDLWESALRLRTIPRTFFHPLVAVYLVKGQSLDFGDLKTLLIVFFVYGLLMYAGLYGLNNYFDRDIDVTNLYKRVRAVASRKLNARLVFYVSIVLVATSLIFGAIFLRSIVYFQLYLIFVNLVYTLVLKRINLLFGSFVVATSDAVKFLVGVAISGGDLGNFVVIALLIWLLLFCFATFKHEYSLTIQPSITLYTVRLLVFVAIIIIGAVLYLDSKYIPLFYIPFYLTPILASQISSKKKLAFVRQLNR